MTSKRDITQLQQSERDKCNGTKCRARQAVTNGNWEEEGEILDEYSQY